MIRNYPQLFVRDNYKENHDTTEYQSKRTRDTYKMESIPYTYSPYKLHTR